jgi:serine/threonine-protein kinase
MNSPRCPSCGALLEADARFCGLCGARLAAASAAAEKTEVATTIRERPGPPPKARSLDGLVGRTLNNRYLVQQKIGEGGFGAVFRGRQIATGREVALKLLHPHNVADSTVVARFRREAEASSRLQNPHAVTIFDFDETEDGVLYLAMELVRGQSLQQLQRSEGPLDPERVLLILDQVADALGEAHANGVVHRDMKPENVMIERREDGDFVKVLDFGIAKIVTEDASKKPALTAVGQTLGTLEFMSPEQLRGKPLDGRSDLYALGIMAYEMLTGELPFGNAQSSTEVIQWHLQEPAPRPSAMRPDLNLPAGVDEVVLKMVAKSRDERHESAAALREHIQEVLAKGRSGGSRMRLARSVAIVAGAVVALAAAVAVAVR